jgi:electron transfer flavoprotein alpha subunit
LSILIYAESAKENSKVAFELASYAKKIESLGTTVTAVTVNADDVSELSKYR